MTASAALDLGSMQRLSGGLQRMASAQDRSSVLAAATNLAHEVSGADGVCVLPEERSEVLFCVRGDPELRSLRNSESMRRLVDSARVVRARVQWVGLVEHLRKANEQLSNLNSMKSKFMSMSSHDLSNSLMTMQVAFEMLSSTISM